MSCHFVFFVENQKFFLGIKFSTFGPLLKFKKNDENEGQGFIFLQKNRDCEQFLHFYHAKIVNIDIRRVHALNTNLDRLVNGAHNKFQQWSYQEQTISWVYSL